jgi:excisionase family DNA binding protein
VLQGGLREAALFFVFFGIARGFRDFYLEERMKESKAQQDTPVCGQLLTVAEAAEYIHMGLTTFYGCIKRGAIPFFRPPRGKILVDTADLDNWLRVSKVPAGTVPGNI